ncbi:MAG: hypothetical protein OXI87_14550 [Albidovulum sp.]|nr:hypothetical protein [Albidovulum sp.]MDE0532548.1 hypothetical protein [Albidovulum sp.]
MTSHVDSPEGRHLVLFRTGFGVSAGKTKQMVECRDQAPEFQVTCRIRKHGWLIAFA